MDGVKKTVLRLVLPRKESGRAFLSVSLREEEEEYARGSAEPSNSRGIAHPKEKPTLAARSLSTKPVIGFSGGWMKNFRMLS